MMNVTQLKTSNDYMLGHADDELDRLIDQSRFLGELTDHLLRMAGLQPGMRVLDVGCGAGDVSFLAARIVGPTGRVLGIDRSVDAIARASQRAAAAGVTNVAFDAADAMSFALESRVDALIGRLVVMYWDDPVAAVRNLARSVRPGGIVTFQEYDLTAVTSEPSCPLFELTLQRLLQAFRRGNAETRMGLKLGRVFEDAGLPAPHMLLSARVERGPESQIYRLVADVTRTVLPLMERTGVAAAADVDIDTLAERLRQEAGAMKATLEAPPLVGAWSRVPMFG